ncbi:MAG: tRNA glutamyl-Q(34) synthetase GluQRS [Solirubrobacteraceae bacterium]
MSEHDGRYAPSPSGPLHLGNLRTALLAWLFARSQGARFLLRIEDLDPQRSRAEHERRQLEDLSAIGIDWDGVPLRQSERRDRHREAFEQLRRAGRAYPCWCTRAEVRRAASAPHAQDRQGAYPGTCRELTAAQRAQRERSSRAKAWRLDACGAIVEFEDLLHGAQSRPVDDFVLWRGDDVPAYNLAVVVDDSDQGVDEVVRGDDLLESTPRQVLLARLLGLPPIRYAHVPLILGPDGRRLAKRHGAVTLADWHGAGASAPALVGWLAASVGLLAPGASIMPGELLGRFDAGRLRRAATLLEPAGACQLSQIGLASADKP